MFERTVDNPLRGAIHFNSVSQPLEVRASSTGDYLCLSVRGHGPSIVVELQEQLDGPFFRAPNQNSSGHGLGLAIARRAIERYDGHLRPNNHPDDDFIATLSLPLWRRTIE